jgi:Tol biopolymer transport system component
MTRKFWFIIGLLATINLFCRLAYGEEKNFIQPCPDAGGYRTWLKEPDGTYINHLGHDYNAPAGTEVKAIADGNVTEIRLDVSGFGSEDTNGPLIWIKHRLIDGRYFHALYGHIMPNSDIKEEWEKGNEVKVKAGQVIGTIIEYLHKATKKDISHLHLGIWNSDTLPQRGTLLGYGPIRHFTNPIEFLQENKPYVDQAAADKSKILFVGTFRTLFSINPDGSDKMEILSEILSKYPGDERLYHLTLSPDRTKIAFPMYPNCISIIDINTREQKKLVAYPPLKRLGPASITNFEHLRWSPDGTKIALEGITGTGSSIYMISMDQPKLLNRLTSHPSYFPSWSLDSKKIVYEQHLFEREPEYSGIYLIDADRTGLKGLASGIPTARLASGIAPEWCPTRNKLAFFGSERQLCVGTLEDNQIKEIKRIGHAPDIKRIRWSPDGTKIAFSNRRKLFVVNANGSNLKEIYNGNNWLIDWVKDFPLE